MRSLERKMAEECVKLANQKFGLLMLCEHLLSDLDYDNETAKNIIEYAKDRDFKSCQQLLDFGMLDDAK